MSFGLNKESTSLQGVEGVKSDVTQSGQLALKIFDSMRSDGGGTIVESKSEIAYAKANLFIDVADLGLLARKSLNAAHYIATTNKPDKTGLYVVETAYFKWLINYDKSNNLTHLKKALRDAQKSAAQINVIDHEHPQNDAWVSVQMIGATAIAGGHVAFRIPDEIIPHLNNPDSFTYLSLRMTSAFTTSYGLALYEKLASLKFRGGSEWMEIGEFRKWIGADNVKTYLEFKNLNRYVLTPAIKQINEISDIKTEYKTMAAGGGRRITHIKFSVTDNPEGRLNLKLGYKDDMRELFDILTVEFGIDSKNLDEIMRQRENYTDNRLREVIEYTRARMAKKKIEYPGLYLMDALRKGYKISPAERSMADKRGRGEPKEEDAKPVDPLVARAKEDALARLNVMGPDDLDELLANFAKTPAVMNNKILLKSLKTKGIAAGMVKSKLIEWMVKKAVEATTA